MHGKKKKKKKKERKKEKKNIYIYIYINIQQILSFGLQVMVADLQIQHIFIILKATTVPSDMEMNDEFIGGVFTYTQICFHPS